MKYVIPSYKRYEQLKLKTLRFLNSHQIKNEDIFIFVRVDDEDLVNYHKLKEDGYNIITSIGIEGIGKTHNYITEYFEENEFICEIDDDLIDIVDKDKNSIVSLEEEIEQMTNIMNNENINYCGLYSVNNSMFMNQSNHFTTDLRYSLGIFRLRRICKDIVLETNYSEDFENNILHYLRDGKMLKNNWLHGITKNYAIGGCNGDGRNNETEKRDKEYLHNKYPEYTRLFQRKSGVWDLRLKHYKTK